MEPIHKERRCVVANKMHYGDPDAIRLSVLAVELSRAFVKLLLLL